LIFFRRTGGGDNVGNHELTELQKRFCEEYLISGIAAAAYRAAGYAPNNADTKGSRLLQNEKIKAYLASRLEAIADAKIAKADEVLRFLTTAMRGELTDEVLTFYYGKPITGIKQVDARERIKAAALLARRYRLLDNPDLDTDKAKQNTAVESFVDALTSKDGEG